MTCVVAVTVAAAAPAVLSTTTVLVPLSINSRKVEILREIPGEQAALRVANRWIDPLKPAASLEAKTLVAAMNTMPVDGLYIVQVDGTRDNQLKAAIAAAGINVVGMVPGRGWIVKVKDAAVPAVRSLRGVRWMGSYAPACRLSDMLVLAASRMPVLDGPDARIKVKAVFLPSASAATTRASIAALGEVLATVQTGEETVFEAIVPVARLAAIAALPDLLVIEHDPQTHVMNSVASDACDVRDMWNTRGYYGNSETVAVADSGLDVGVKTAAIHDDFEDGAGNSRVVALYDFLGDGAGDPYSGHGTHVAGSVLGNGKMSGANPTNSTFPSTCYAGMAPKAKLVFQAQGSNNPNVASSIYLPTDLNSLFRTAYTNGARIHQDSWGSDAYGVYNTSSRQLDEFCFYNPDMLICFSAGNAGVDLSPTNGVIDLGSMGSPGSAKNCLTVGATENMRTGEGGTWGTSFPGRYPIVPIYPDHIANNTNGMAGFSSRGPCSDGRIKPDIVAPGTYIASVRTHAAPISSNILWGQGALLSGNSNYVYSGGTSMACPLASGAAAVLREYLRSARGMSNPPAALLKAILLNGATDIAPGQYGTVTQEVATAPNNAEGWGRLTLDDSVFGASSHRMLFWTNAMSGAGVIASTITVYGSNEPFKTILTWTDFPGSVMSLDTSFSYLGGGGIVNDLDLRVIDPGGNTNYPRAMNPFVNLYYYTNNISLTAYSNLGAFEAERCTAPQVPMTATVLESVLYDSTGKGGNYALFIWADNGSGAPGATLFAVTNTLASGSIGTKIIAQGLSVTITAANFFIGFQKLAANVYQSRDPSSTSPRTYVNTGSGWSFNGGGDMWMHVYGTASTGDHVNSVEGIVITNPVPGTYRVETRGVNVPYGPARFAVAVSGILAPIVGLPFVNITNADRTVGYLVTTCDIGGTNNTDVVGGMRWTNTLTQVSGTLAATSSWSITGIALNVGSNSIMVSGTNLLTAIAVDTVTVVRAQAQPGELAPFLDATNSPVTVWYDVSSYAVAGTNNVHVVGGMWATNTNAGGTRQVFSAFASWTAPALGLVVGSNTIMVSGTNALGVVTNDTVVITRSAYAQSNIETFEVSRGASYGLMQLSWSNGAITVLACTNRYYPTDPANWFVLTNNVSSPWSHSAASNFASVYYRIVSGTFTSRYDVGKFDVDIAAGSIAWLGFPFAVQPGCDTLGDWFGRQLEARNYNAYSYPMLQVQNSIGGSIITRSYYINNVGDGTTNWFSTDDLIVQNAGYVLFMPPDHPAVKLTSLGMVPTNSVAIKVPYQTIPWVGMSYPSSVDMRDSGLVGLFTPPQKYSLFDYDFANSQQVLGGPVWYAEYFIDNWGSGTTNFFIDVVGADMINGGKGYLLFFSTTRTGTGTWTWVKPY